ncbi:MAG: type II toxin-antitoxin system RelE/ParE family toxin [Acidimicrobiia bacterium]
MSTPEFAFEIEFYATASGREPAREFIEDLEPAKRATLVAAIKAVLQYQGKDVCQTEYGKPLGKGLFEFRVRDDEITLRVYFHPYGNKVLLLLCGYDKGRFGGGRREQKAISRARRHLNDYKESTRRHN